MDYKEAGVDYTPLDKLKRFAQAVGLETSGGFIAAGGKDVSVSIGESARVIDLGLGNFYLAMVGEGLGTKNLVADEKSINQRAYHGIGWDTVAMIVNDLAVVGAKPVMVTAHWGLGSSEFLEKNPKKGNDLVRGWAAACTYSGALYAGGETPMLKGIIYPDTIELSGSAVGVIDPKERLVLGQNLCAGDHIILVGSSGIHANGLTLARSIAEKLPDGYQTKLPDGRSFGEALLVPTNIYVPFVQKLLKSNIIPHYMVHITGHGWRKLMRAQKEFTYRIHSIPQPHREFDFMQRKSNISDEEMYGTFNMGAGFAVMVPEQAAESVMKKANASGFLAWDAGVVEDGPKQVIIEPKDIIFNADTFHIR